MLRLEDAKKLLLRDYDPFLSLIRPLGEDNTELDEEFLTLKKSYEDQKRSEAITSTHPRKTGLYSLTKIQRLPHVITSTTIGSSCFRYRLSSFGRVAQKLHDPVIARWLESDFEKDEYSSVPRGLMYDAYLEFCRANKCCVSNQACFGKAVRNVFPYLQTRRIGVRGNSNLRKSIRSLKKPLKLENFSHEPGKMSVPAVKINARSNSCDGFKAVIKILIPDFASHETLNVHEDIFTEAHALLDSMEKYAFDILRAIMQAPEKSDFTEVFSANAEFWKTVCQTIEDDTILTNPDILELMTDCDTQVQRTISDILLPDLLAPMSEEKTDKLRTLFGGDYLQEMMAAVQPAPEQVRQIKRRVYKKFSIEMLERLNFMRLVNKVDESFENMPIARILQKAFLKLDVDCMMSKCRFAFAMKRSDFMTTEKMFRKGLTTFQASLNNGFHVRGCLNWVRSQVLNQIQLDKQHNDCKDRITVTLLCFSYATSLIFGELVKHFPLQLQTGQRKLQMLLTDYVSYAIKDELKTAKCVHQQK